jgi:hypothetical protein
MINHLQWAGEPRPPAARGSPGSPLALPDADAVTHLSADHSTNDLRESCGDGGWPYLKPLKLVEKSTPWDLATKKQRFD